LGLKIKAARIVEISYVAYRKILAFKAFVLYGAIKRIGSNPDFSVFLFSRGKTNLF